MATRKQRQTARRNVKKAQAAARQKKTITKLPKKTRTALGREGAKAAARKRGATKGTGTGAGAMTVTELRREAARLGIEGRLRTPDAHRRRASIALPPRPAEVPRFPAEVGDAATVRLVRIATWNVNSVKQRVARLLPWLDERQPDVVCLQETKLADDAFAELLGAALADRGYEVALHGEPAWNGVAILSRVGLEDPVAGLEGA